MAKDTVNDRVIYMEKGMAYDRVDGMVIRHGKRKHPSRIRYEQAHPVISIRVDLDTYEKIKGLQEKTGKSLATIMREGLGLQEASINEAYEKGYRDAEDMYKFSFPCSICGGDIVMTNNHDSVRLVKEKLKGICHAGCNEKANINIS